MLDLWSGPVPMSLARIQGCWLLKAGPKQCVGTAFCSFKRRKRFALPLVCSKKTSPYTIHHVYIYIYMHVFCVCPGNDHKKLCLFFSKYG